MSEQTSARSKSAIVIGASMAGLLAARALANHFQQVTVLERDTFPLPGKNRRGVPQGKHIHILLERGRQIMEGYLPGLTSELVDLGAVYIADASLSVRWFHGDDYHQPGRSGIAGVAVSRPTLEAAVRARVLALPNVKAVEGRRVVGLLATPGSSGGDSRVTGVRLADRHGSSGEQTMAADLMIDATGRGSRSPVWLEELGYERPEENAVRIEMGYSTCLYDRKPEDLPGLNGIVILPMPPNKHLGVLMVQDGGRWVLTLGGYLGEHSPTDYQGFLGAASQLPSPDIYNVVKDAEPLDGPFTYKFRANLRRRYEKLARFPKGYLVLGDALCSFNPIYGQGMTVAAMEAQALEESLGRGQDQLGRRFFARAAKVVNASWDSAVGNDLTFAEVQGPRTPAVRLLNWYIDKLHQAAHNDAEVSIAFLKAINMVAPPASMMHPRIVWRVLRGNLWARQGKAPGASERSLSRPGSVAAPR